MERKTLKFKDNLVKLILTGEKDSTWRLFDDKDLMEEDTVDLINSDTKENFGEASLIKVYEKKMGELTEEDFDGHEKFANEEEMYKTYRTYYGDRVEQETIVKIIKFKI